MKLTLLVACLWLLISQAEAQSVSPPMHFHQDGFVKNEGQFCDQSGKENKQVEYLYAKKDFHLALTASGFSYELIQETTQATDFPEDGFSDPDDLQDWQNLEPIEESVNRINVTFKGSNPHPEIIADRNTGTEFNYFIGKIAVSHVPAFNRITYKEIYKGIDLVFEDHQSENGPEYSFIVHPGADADQIKMMYSGAGNLHLEDQHTLAISTPKGFIKETGLMGYWQEDGTPSDVSFHLKKGILTFNAEQSKSKTLVIDPFVVWGTYLGGNGTETYLEEAEINLDRSLNIYQTGSTTSSNYISTTGAYMTTYGGSRDILFAKFSNDGVLLWATYFGGNALDVAYGVNFDSYDNPIITGTTKSANVPTTSGVFQTVLQGVSDVLLAKFTPAGQLTWCTLMGGTNDNTPKKEFENGRGIICDVNDFIYVDGYVQSASNIGTTGAFQATYKGGGDAFLAKFTKDGQKVWGTYFSGTGKDRAHDLCFDPFGHIYIVGSAASKKNWITGGFQTHYGGFVDGFIAKFDTVGNYYWSSYYGGVAQDHGRSVKCDQAGNVYFAGWTGASEANVISTPGCYQQNYSGSLDGFLVKFAPMGARVWGTYFGGPDLDQFFSMAIDKDANLYLCGITASLTGIATGDAFQAECGGGHDDMIVKFNSNGELIWSSYFGGTTKDEGFDIDRDTLGNIYLTVNTHGDLPVSSDAHQTAVHGQDDLSVFKIDFTECEDPVEPNESFPTAFYLTDTLSLTPIVITGAIKSPTDQDWFVLHLNPEDTMVTLTLSEAGANYDLNVFTTPETLIASTSNSGRIVNKIITLQYQSGDMYLQIAHDALIFSAFDCYTVSIVSFVERVSETLSAVSQDHHLKIYPNPSSGLMTAELENCKQGNVSIAVFDATGRIVFNQQESASDGTNKFSLDLSDLKSGLYFLQANDGNNRSMMKFLIQK